jgi:hypothetical protein
MSLRLFAWIFILDFTGIPFALEAGSQEPEKVESGRWKVEGGK